MATYLVKKSVYDSATAGSKCELNAMRLSDNSVVGSTETITSDVVLPNTRIPSVPDTGTSSSSGSLDSEWNIDEQDDLIASAMCSSWVEDSTKETNSPSSSGDISKYYELVLGTNKDLYYMIKYFDQTPKEWRMFNDIQINQMSITMELNSFVKMSFDCLGSNNPKGVSSDPTVNATYGVAKTTKAFKTLSGSIKMGTLENNFSSMTPIRQSPSFNLTVNNNKERTDALFETEAIEMSDGDFEVSGTLDIWKADSLGMSMFNEAVDGTDKCIEVTVSREWKSETDVDMVTEYHIQLKAHFQTPSESKDGNKYKVSVPYTVNFDEGIKFIKIEKIA